MRYNKNNNLALEDKLHENSMTIFYSKNTGKIIAICGGVQDFTFFSEDAKDKESFCFRAIVDRNNNIIENWYKYIIDLTDNRLIPKPIDEPQVMMSINPIV